MEKYFLLIAGDNYYPSARTGDWIGCFESEQEARVEIEIQGEPWTSGYMIRGTVYDWYDIIDLRDWINKENN